MYDVMIIVGVVERPAADVASRGAGDSPVVVQRSTPGVDAEKRGEDPPFFLFTAMRRAARRNWMVIKSNFDSGTILNDLVGAWTIYYCWSGRSIVPERAAENYNGHRRS